MRCVGRWGFGARLATLAMLLSVVFMKLKKKRQRYRCSDCQREERRSHRDHFCWPPSTTWSVDFVPLLYGAQHKGNPEAVQKRTRRASEAFKRGSTTRHLGERKASDFRNDSAVGRSTCQHDGRILVIASILAPSSSGHLARETAALHRVLPVRSQYAKTRERTP